MSTQDTVNRIWALGRGEPVTIARALAAGITRSQMRAALGNGSLSRAGHGVIQAQAHVGDTPSDDTVRRFDDTVRRCRTLAVRRPGLVFSHQTAAILHGLPLLNRVQHEPIHAFHRHPRRLSAGWLHDWALDPGDVVHVGGLQVTSILRTANDLARTLPFSEALIPMDCALRRTVITHAETSRAGQPGARQLLPLPEDRIVEDPESGAFAQQLLQGHVIRSTGRPGVSGARRVAAAASPLAESPAESWSRGQMIAAGIPIRGLQVRVLDAEGVERRLDFLLEVGLAGEVDGYVKYEGTLGRQQVRKEKMRDLALARVGIHTVRWSAEEVFRNPTNVMAELRRAMALHQTGKSSEAR